MLSLQDLIKKMVNTIKIEKLTRKNSFNLLCIKKCALLKEQGIWASLFAQPMKIDKSVLKQQEEKVHLLILLLLFDEVLCEVFEKKIAFVLWLKLEKFVLMKSIFHKLLLKWHLFGLYMKEDTPLKDHLDELPCLVGALWNWYQIKRWRSCNDYVSLFLSFIWEFCEFFKVLERIASHLRKSSPVSIQESFDTTFGNGGEAFAFGLSIINSAKRQKKKAKDSRRSKLIQRTSVITTKNLTIGRKIVQRKSRKILFQLLFKVIRHQKMIWYSHLLINNTSLWTIGIGLRFFLSYESTPKLVCDIWEEIWW